MAPVFEEQAPFPTFARDGLIARRLLVPADFAVRTDVTAQLLTALTAGMHPVSLELIGHGGGVQIQIVTSTADAAHVTASIGGYLPDVSIVDEGDLLEDVWVWAAESVVVDFGYADEFFLPFNGLRAFHADPYIPLIAALAAAKSDETLCYQVLFESPRNPWREGIMGAVLAPDGSPLFSDAPEFVPLAREKVSQPLYACALRLGANAQTRARAIELIRGTSAFFAQLARPGGNQLMPLENDGYPDDEHEHAFLRRESHRTGMIASADELMVLAHVPDASVRHEALARDERRTKALPAVAKGHRFVIGENVHRGVREPVTLGTSERLAHTMIVGASGTGKSMLLVNMIRQDIERGEGVLVLDPHGDLIDDVLAGVPANRADDVILFDPSDNAYPIGFNVLDAASERERILLASDLVAVFARLSTSWGDTMGAVLSNAVIAMLESSEGGTFLHLRRFLIDEAYRSAFLKTVEDDEVLFFWRKEWPLIGARSIGPILTRLNAFLRPRLIRHMVGQRRPRLRLPDVIDGQKIFLAKLSQGLIGNENAYLLGSLILSRFVQLALARQSEAKSTRKPFWIYLDEAEHFVTPSVAALVTEARKYSVGMTLAFQMLSQLRSVPQVEQAVLGNAHTRIVFRVGDDDARKLADGLSAFDAKDLRNLGVGEAIGRIGAASQDFNLRTLLAEPISEMVESERRLDIQTRSRERYAVPVVRVTAELASLRETTEAESTNGTLGEAPAPEAPGSADTASHAPVRPAPPNRTRPPPRPEAQPLGKGGPEHKYLQHVVSRLSIERGFRAEIERPIPDGQVDVALYREDLSIACEISVTTGTEHELGNIRKCLDAGFSQVWLVVPDTKRRAAMVKAVRKRSDTGAVQVLGIEDLVNVLEANVPAPQLAEHMVAGYKVKASRGSVSPADAAQRRAAIAEVLARSATKRRSPPA
ncbi:MAG: type IV secretion system DNA-binding domain-containing protein [Nevskia sp.]|nr:type IV secretion system DNA-binding domain-containing protein [Nevskia sp.]